MTSGSEVRATYGNLNTNITKTKSSINGLASTWTGTSHDAIITKSTKTIDKYIKILKESFNQFAIACDKYEKYQKKKNRLEKVKESISKYTNILNKGNGGFSTDIILSNYQNEKGILEKDLKKLKKEIKEALGNVKSVNAKKSSNKGVPDSVSKKVRELKQQVEDEKMNKKLIDSLYSQIGNTKDDYPSRFNYEAWCADFVSYNLINNGYNVEWSSWAGNAGPDSIYAKVLQGGGKEHLGELSSNYGKTPDKSYTPQPGDVFLIDTDGDGDINHTGIVVKDLGNQKVRTIEGNTSYDDGSYNHGVVNEKERDKSTIYGYATPVKKLEKKDDTE